MSRATKAFALGFGLALGSCAPAYAQEPPQQVCGPRSHILKSLQTTYKEEPLAVALTPKGDGVVEVLVDPVDGSFTILRTPARGRTCIIAAGKAWTMNPTWGRPGV